MLKVSFKLIIIESNYTYISLMYYFYIFNYKDLGIQDCLTCLHFIIISLNWCCISWPAIRCSALCISTSYRVLVIHTISCHDKLYLYFSLHMEPNHWNFDEGRWGQKNIHPPPKKKNGWTWGLRDVNEKTPRYKEIPNIRNFNKIFEC